MVATALTLETLPSIDPATGQIRASFERTPVLQVPQLMVRARRAQVEWAKVPLHERCARIGVLKTKIFAAGDALTDAVVAESGKPRVEAKFADVFVADAFALRKSCASQHRREDEVGFASLRTARRPRHH